MPESARWLANLGSSDDAVNVAIALLRRKLVEGPVINPHQEVEAADITQLTSRASATYATLVHTVKSLQKQLAAFQQVFDRGLDSFCDNLAMFITTDDAAFQAKLIYDTRWFQTLQFSTSAKIAIATRLCKEVSKFNPSYVSPLWESLMKYDPDMMKLVVLRQDDNQIFGIDFYVPNRGTGAGSAADLAA